MTVCWETTFGSSSVESQSAFQCSIQLRQTIMCPQLQRTIVPIGITCRSHMFTTYTHNSAVAVISQIPHPVIYDATPHTQLSYATFLSKRSLGLCVGFHVTLERTCHRHADSVCPVSTGSPVYALNASDDDFTANVPNHCLFIVVRLRRLLPGYVINFCSHR